MWLFVNIKSTLTVRKFSWRGRGEKNNTHGHECHPRRRRYCSLYVCRFVSVSLIKNDFWSLSIAWTIPKKAWDDHEFIHRTFCSWKKVGKRMLLRWIIGTCRTTNAGLGVKLLVVMGMAHHWYELERRWPRAQGHTVVRANYLCTRWTQHSNAKA